MNAYELEIGQLVKIVRLDGNPYNGPTLRISVIGKIDGLKRWGPLVRGHIVEIKDYSSAVGAPISTHASDLELLEPPSS